MFQAYGQLTDVTIEEEGCAGYVVFLDVIDAFIAKMRLDKMKLVRDNATLHVKFFIKPKSSPSPKREEEELKLGERDSSAVPSSNLSNQQTSPFVPA